MKLSDLNIENIIRDNYNPSIELPNTDENLIIRDVDQIVTFISEYGNVDCVWNERKARIEVPSFADGRARAEANKLAWCNRFGSE